MGFIGFEDAFKKTIFIKGKNIIKFVLDRTLIAVFNNACGGTYIIQSI